MKRKFADYQKHKSIEKCIYKNIRVDNEKFHGNISLVDILKVKKVWILERKNGDKDCILDKGYKYLEVLPDNSNYVITGIYDDKCNIVEWYIDIVKGISEENGRIYFDDLYLDIILIHNREIDIADEDELEIALKEKDITEEDYKLVLKTKEEILAHLVQDYDRLKAFTDKYLEILLKK